MGFADLSDFKQLECRIDELIKLNTSLKEQNRVLLDRIHQNDQDIRRLKDRIVRLYEQKSLVYSKVVDLIEKLEKIEVSDQREGCFEKKHRC